jgi:hypothetical protein
MQSWILHISPYPSHFQLLQLIRAIHHLFHATELFALPCTTPHFCSDHFLSSSAFLFVLSIINASPIVAYRKSYAGGIAIRYPASASFFPTSIAMAR